MKCKLSQLYFLLVALLIIAMLPIKCYGFYILLKFFVCALFGYRSVEFFNRNQSGMAWLYGAIALLYNPIIRFPLGRPTWTLINIATIIIVAIVAKRKGFS